MLPCGGPYLNSEALSTTLHHLTAACSALASQLVLSAVAACMMRATSFMPGAHPIGMTVAGVHPACRMPATLCAAGGAHVWAARHWKDDAGQGSGHRDKDDFLQRIFIHSGIEIQVRQQQPLVPQHSLSSY